MVRCLWCICEIQHLYASPWLDVETSFPFSILFANMNVLLDKISKNNIEVIMKFCTPILGAMFLYIYGLESMDEKCTDFIKKLPYSSKIFTFQEKISKVHGGVCVQNSVFLIIFCALKFSRNVIQIPLKIAPKIINWAPSPLYDIIILGYFKI